MFGIGATELVILLIIMIISLAPILFIAVLLKWALGGSRGSREREAEETRIIQEIHSGLARLEQRVESLETLLLDSGKDTKSK